MLEGAAAEAWQVAPSTLVATAVAQLDDALGQDHSAVLPSRMWRAPERAPLLDQTVGYNGSSVQVRCWHPVLAAALDHMMAPIRSSGTPRCTLDLLVEESRTALLVDGVFKYEVPRIAWTPLIRRLARELHPERAFAAVVHAATVISPGRGQVMIAGATGAGKTTLALGLLAAGGTLLADDVTPIEVESHLAWPCGLAMGVKQGSWSILDRLFPQLAEASSARIAVGPRNIRFVTAFRQAPADQGRPISMLIFPQWTAGSSLHITPLRPAEALRRLASGGTWPVDDSHHLPEFLAWLQSVPAYHLVYDDLSHGVEAVHGLLCSRRS
ncbi:hypothetical protein [Geminicoccus harenae]|uniref:hypothetical protein n=1 Tax=Geminicoccus harenae TaxID=2498453 RepID=UPI00168B03C4|nr:hypothetical protein [Geminicoccus harenae]